MTETRQSVVRISDLAPSLSEQMAVVHKATDPGGRHTALLQLAMEGVVFLASVALTDYRERRPHQPSEDAEQTLERLCQAGTNPERKEADKFESFGKYVGLIREAGEATSPDGYLCPEATERDRPAIRRLKAAITRLKDQEIKQPEHDLSEALRRTHGRGEEQFSLSQAWDQLGQYRNHFEHGNTNVKPGSGWPRKWPGYYQGMNPILQEALLESMDVPALDQIAFARWGGTSNDEVATFTYQRSGFAQHIQVPLSESPVARKGKTYLFHLGPDGPEFLHTLLDLGQEVTPYLRSEPRADTPVTASASASAASAASVPHTIIREDRAPTGTHVAEGPWCALATKSGLMLVTGEGASIEVRTAKRADGNTPGRMTQRHVVGGTVTDLEATVGDSGILAAFERQEHTWLLGAVDDRNGGLHLLQVPVSVGIPASILAARARRAQWTATLGVGDIVRTLSFDSEGRDLRARDEQGPVDAFATSDAGPIRLSGRSVDGGGPGVDDLEQQWTDIDAHTTDSGCWIVLAAEADGGTEVYALHRGPGGSTATTFWSSNRLDRLRLARPNSKSVAPLVVGSADGLLRWWPWPAGSGA